MNFLFRGLLFIQMLPENLFHSQLSNTVLFSVALLNDPLFHNQNLKS